MSANELGLILNRISRIAERLGDRVNEVVFIGGCIASLLITDKASLRVRPTKDVDVIIQTRDKSSYYRFEETLRSLGFRQKMIGDDPICRWHFEDLMLDVMPTDQNILSFGNEWYEIAYRDSQPYELPDGKTIRVISAPLFICTKLNAYDTRGKNYKESHDIEDVISVVDGRPELKDEIAKSDKLVQEYLKTRFKDLLSQEAFISALEWHVPYDAVSGEREVIIVERMEEIATMAWIES